MATTINAYSVGLGLDASQYIHNSQLSRKETNFLKREIASAKTPAEKYEEKLTRLDNALAQGAIELGVYTRLVAKAQVEMRKADKSTKSLGDTSAKATAKLELVSDKMQKASRSAERLDSSVQGVGFGKLAAGLITVSALTSGFQRLSRVVADFTVESVTLAGKMEMTELQFKNLIGSAELSKSVLKDLKDFTARTPFQFDDISRSARTLLTFGTSTQDLQRELKILGNVASATGANLNDFATILGRARGSNAVGLEDINRIADRGVAIYDLLATRLNVATDEIRSMASTGRLEASDLMAVFEALGDTGGRFGDSMEEASIKLEGRISTLKDNFAALEVQIGERLVPQTTQLVIGLTEVVKTIKTTDFSPYTDGANRAMDVLERLNSLVMMPLTIIAPDLGIQDDVEALLGAAGKAAELQEKMLAAQQNMSDKAAGREIETRDLAASAKTIADLEKKVASAQSEQVRKQEQVIAARERYEKRLRDIAKREAAEYKQFIERFEAAIAQGPGSGAIDDRAGFLAQQKNAELAAEARRNFELQGGGKDTTDFAARADAAKELQKLAKLEHEAQKARQEANELLKQLNDTKPRRVR